MLRDGWQIELLKARIILPSASSTRSCRCDVKFDSKVHTYIATGEKANILFQPFCGPHRPRMYAVPSEHHDHAAATVATSTSN